MQDRRQQQDGSIPQWLKLFVTFTPMRSYESMNIDDHRRKKAETKSF